MNGQGAGAETIPFSVAVKAQGNIEDWLCDLLFKMQVRSTASDFEVDLVPTSTSVVRRFLYMCCHHTPRVWSCLLVFEFFVTTFPAPILRRTCRCDYFPQRACPLTAK